MSMTLQALAHEIRFDPASLGYATPYAAGAYDVVARLLNTVSASIATPKLLADQKDVLSAIAPADIAASTNTVVGAWANAVLSLPAIPVNTTAGADTPIMDGLQSLLTGGSTSLTNLNAAAVRAGSRAEYLFGVGVKISVQDILASRKYIWPAVPSVGLSTAVTASLHVYYLPHPATIGCSTAVTATLTAAQ